ncbi:C2H2 type zinc finger domain protein [Penicillium brasilianum]|uniref:C2H2 type zinc finger domain protein n=1 Tax=Penicillium brasilianum TaxID=104259 RepID=A0A1S9RWU4_PENBI|nr:C2H2 type zinc finger domain protein [Penicillium brasilianum]
MVKHSRSHSCSRSPSPNHDSPFSSNSIPSSPTCSTISTTALPSDRSKVPCLKSAELTEVMHCTLPPHRETVSFASYEDYEVHYQQAHVNRCSECSKNFPTAHFLNLHIAENHDSLVVAMRERGEKTYGCFVEDCERKCSTPRSRRLHLIDKHMFPRTYNFYIVNDGIDNQTSLLRPLNKSNRRRISSASISSIQEGRLRHRNSVSQPSAVPQSPVRSEKISDEMEVDSLAQSMSALRFVPASVMKNRVKVAQKNV